MRRSVKPNLKLIEGTELPPERHFLPAKQHNLEFDAELGNRVLDCLCRGMTLVAVCRRDDMPSYATVMRWRDENPFFHDVFEKASEIGGRVMGEMAVQILLDETDPAQAYLTRAKSEALYRQAGRMAPRIYGDKFTLTSKTPGGVERSITIETVDPQVASRAYQRLIAGEPKEES